MTALQKLPKPFFVLAPMDDVTDTVFRQVVADCAAPDLFFTEFVNVDGLQSPGRSNLLRKLQFSSKEKPMVAQIWGLKPENFYRTAEELLKMGYAGIDINMGCPEKTVVKNGACAGLINNRNLAVEIIQATQAGVSGKVPVSVKTRLGFNAIDYSWPELLLCQNLQMLTIHGRTRSQMSKVPADWEAIGHIRALRDSISPGTLLVGNGDVMNRQQGLVLAERYKLDGIMIGRGIFSDPFAFSETPIWHEYMPQQRLELYRKHIHLFAGTWLHNERSVVTLNKFCKLYINGFTGAKELREQLMNTQSLDEMLLLLDRFKVTTNSAAKMPRRTQPVPDSDIEQLPEPTGLVGH